jgi:fimbrial chaperone protein
MNKRILTTLLVALLATGAKAGSFSVTPVRIFMVPKDRAVAVTLTNEGDTEIALQADIHVWGQKPDGTDQLDLTEDLVLSPPIIKLPARGRQVVRLALLRSPDANKQLTYRMIVKEVPEATAPKDRVIQVPIALALSLPVFMTPPAAKREIGCQMRAAEGSVNVSCVNQGTAYAQIREVIIRQAGNTVARFEGGTYVLPGAKKIISIKPTLPLVSGDTELKLVFDDGVEQVSKARL